MSPRILRRIVVAVFVVGIGGMIGGSIADNNGTAVTFGLVTAVAALGLILVTSAAGPGAFARDGAEPPLDETLALDVEARIEALVAAGADEDEVRRLVRQAVELGRGPH